MKNARCEVHVWGALTKTVLGKIGHGAKLVATRPAIDDEHAGADAEVNTFVASCVDNHIRVPAHNARGCLHLAVSRGAVPEQEGPAVCGMQQGVLQHACPCIEVTSDEHCCITSILRQAGAESKKGIVGHNRGEVAGC